MLFTGFTAHFYQFDMFTFFMADRGILRLRRQHGRNRRRAFIDVIDQRMPVKGDDQRHRLRFDQLNLIFLGNVLLPERRQVNFGGIKEVTSAVGLFAGDPVTGNRALEAVDVFAFGGQDEFIAQDNQVITVGNRCLSQAFALSQIPFNGVALLLRKFSLAGGGEMYHGLVALAASQGKPKETPSGNDCDTQQHQCHDYCAHPIPVLTWVTYVNSVKVLYII